MLQVTSFYESLANQAVSLGSGRRRGSGFVVAGDRVALLRRSLGGEPSVRVRLGDREQPAELVAEDPSTGLAIVAVPTGDAAPTGFADADAVAGQPVVAIGDPGTGLRVTEGRVSAAPLTIRSATGLSLTALEHTAPLPRGTGGGPLLDADGSLVGVNIVRGDPGFIVALAGSTVQRSIEQMLSGRPGPPRLGVAIASAAVAARLRRAVGLPHRPGLLVRDVEDGSTAAAAGVRAGDLLVRLGDTELLEIHHVQDALASAGDTGSLELVRGAEELALELSLAPPRG